MLAARLMIGTQSMSIKQRLRSLEQRAPAARADGMTAAEWVQWRITGEQPERWLSSSEIQTNVRVMLARSEAVEQMLREMDSEQG